MPRSLVAMLALTLGLSAQPDSFIVTARATRARLNSLRTLADGTLLYTDAFGVYRLRGNRSETLMTIPSQEAGCIRMFGRCLFVTPAVYFARALASDSSGEIYVADPEKHIIARFDQNTQTFVTLLENAGSPTALVADERGGLYFNDPAGCRVRYLNQRAVTTVAGTGTCGYTNDGGAAIGAAILSVTALALDAEGGLFIGDNQAGVVRRVDPNGIITTVAGTGSRGEGAALGLATRTPLQGVGGLAIDSQGNLYIAETLAHRVRRVGADGVIRTVAGTGTLGHDGDYSLAASAQLTSPTCLALTESGALRICDSDRIRHLIPNVPGRWNLPVVNLSDPTGQGFRPGAWMSLLGHFPGIATLDWSSAIGPDGSLPTTLGHVAVEVNGQNSVLSYVSADRIDFLVPANLGVGFPGPVAFKLVKPDGTVAYAGLSSSLVEFLATVSNGKIHVAATTESLAPIGPNRPARPGEMIKLFVTGLNLTAAFTPATDPRQENWMQLVVASRGYPVMLARPFSPGVSELTVQLPSDLPTGDLPIALAVGGYLSRSPRVLTVAHP